MAKFRIQYEDLLSTREEAEKRIKLGVPLNQLEIVEELEVIEIDRGREIIIYYLIWAIFLVVVFILSIALTVLLTLIKYL